MNYTYEQIREHILRWSRQYWSAEFWEHTVEKEDMLLFDLKFQHCLAQITVDKPYCAPYQHVFFEALSLEEEETTQPKRIYLFCDSEDTTLNEVLEGLDAGIQYCLNY